MEYGTVNVNQSIVDLTTINLILSSSKAAETRPVKKPVKLSDEYVDPLNQSCLNETATNLGHISTKEIVDLLITDEYYVTNWKQFYYDLRAPHPDFVQLEMLYNSGARPFHDIIMKILNNWVAIQRNPPSVRKLYGVLLSGDFVSVAETLIKAFPLTATIIPEQSTHTVRSIRSQVLNFEVPPSPFIGPLTNRTKEMVQLIDHFKFNRRAVVVTGPTSVGKTSLVAHFAATEFDGSCIWIDAKNSATFTNSFSRLAAKLEISPDLSAAKILEKVYTLVSNRPIMFVFDSISSPQLETEITQLIQIFNEYPQPYPFFVLLTRSSKMFSTISDRVVLNALEYVKCFTIIYALVETICGLGYLVVGSYGMQMYNDGSFRTRILTSSIVAGVTMLIHQVLLIVWRKVERKNDDKNVRHGKIFRIFSILMIIIIFAALIVILLDAWTYVFADDEDEAYVILTVLMHISNITVVEYFIYLLFTSCIMLGPCFKVCF